MIKQDVVIVMHIYNFMSVSNLRQVGGFYGYPGFPINKTDRHDITEILLKVALNTITITIVYDRIPDMPSCVTPLSTIFQF
jgi:hypothetical protein